MEERILVNLATDHTFESETNIIGREGEGNTTRLEITVPSVLCNCDVYLDFEKPNGDKLRTPKLEIESGVAVYDVVPYLLTDEGEIKIQAVLKTVGGGTWKSTIKTYFNYHSINAEDYINNYPEKEDFLSEAQKLLDGISGEIEEIADFLSKNEDFINTIVNTIEEARWVNTVDGTRLKFFVGTQAEYDALEDKQNLFAIITDDATKNALLGDIDSLKTRADYLERKTDSLEHNFNLTKGKVDRQATKINENTYHIESLRNPIFRPVGSIVLTPFDDAHLTGTIPDVLYEKIRNKICLVTWETSRMCASGVIAIKDNYANHGTLDCAELEIWNTAVTLSEPSTSNLNLYFYIIGSIGEVIGDIEFTIDGTTYQAEENMTWEDWVYSAFNTNGILRIVNGGVVNADGTKYVSKNNDSPELSSDVITASAYTTVALYGLEVDTTISFGMHGIGYLNAVKGMTWAEWVVNKNYNTIGASVADANGQSLIVVPVNDYAIGVVYSVNSANENIPAYATSEIIENGAYQLKIAVSGEVPDLDLPNIIV